jgi:hypothetical protein
MHERDFITHACDFHTYGYDIHTHAYELTRYVLVYFITIYTYTLATGTCLRLACVSNQYSERHCNRTRLRVGTTRIREDSRGIRTLNSLPVSARSSSSLPGFKRIVRDFLGILN